MSRDTEVFHRARAAFVDEMIAVLGAFGLEPADLRYEARVSPQGVTIAASWSDLVRHEAGVPIGGARDAFAVRIRDAFRSAVVEAFARQHTMPAIAADADS